MSQEDMLILKITHRGVDRLHVELAAANEMRFDILVSASSYDQVLADICAVAPVLLRYDVDLAESYDSGLRTQPKMQDRHAINGFVRKYAGRIRDANIGFGEFTRLES